MTDRGLIIAELQNLQKILEAKADICIGAGKMKLLSFANACSGALKLLNAKDINVLTKWRKFEFREPDEEEKANHPEWCHIIENTPDDGEEILASNGRYVWKDEFCDNGDECYLDSGHEMEGCWWTPLPEPPKEGDGE